jgi:acetylornithine deacetylase/succinyl-diaminopimelate desuccinylase-like protein
MTTATASLDLLRTTIARRVAFRTESQDPEQAGELRRYLTDEIGPSLAALGFEWTLWDNPVAGAPAMLFAKRIEDPSKTTVLTYGHGDVVLGYDAQWKRAASRGSSKRKATAGTDGARPTTKASTRSIWQRSGTCSRPAARSASTSRC